VTQIGDCYGHIALAAVVVIFLLCLPFVNGCGDDSDIPHVVYPDQLPQPAPDYVFQLPIWRVGETDMEIPIAESVQAGWRLAFDGGVTAEHVEDLPHAILIMVEQSDARGEIVYFNSTGADVQQRNSDGEPLEPEGGVYAYHLELEGPDLPGVYKISLFESSANSSGYFATGVLTVVGADP
jgi:hypothetical protein